MEATNNLILVSEYAKQKGISLVSVYNRIKKGYVKTQLIKGTMFIDVTLPDETPRRGRKPIKSNAVS